MFERDIKLPQSHSFFLFGARGTGKTTWLKEHFRSVPHLRIDLLDAEEEEKLSLDPKELVRRIDALAPDIRWIVIDEIQKVPALLDLVHKLIEERGIRFALTGSSARKLKRGGANLLAGRAFVFHLFPLTERELGSAFDLNQALRWGTLPHVSALAADSDKQLFLKAYANSYLREEIAAEQLVRGLGPFRRFLNIAAQTSGQILNYAKIARDVGVHANTVQSYYEILEDTLVGRFLLPFHESIRKRQAGNPKFYFFDCGVKRAIDRTLTVELLPQTYEFGTLFEHFIVNEIDRRQRYGQCDYQLSFLATYEGAEIDLIVERPGKPRALIEIKSANHITEDDVRHLRKLGGDIPHSESFCFSRDPQPKIVAGVRALPWQQGLAELGLGSARA